MDTPSTWPEAAGHHETEIYTPAARERLVYPFSPGPRPEEGGADTDADTGPAVVQALPPQSAPHPIWF